VWVWWGDQDVEGDELGGGDGGVAGVMRVELSTGEMGWGDRDRVVGR
jgi:hypothetical protein